MNVHTQPTGLRPGSLNQCPGGAQQTPLQRVREDGGDPVKGTRTDSPNSLAMRTGSNQHPVSTETSFFH